MARRSSGLPVVTVAGLLLAGRGGSDLQEPGAAGAAGTQTAAQAEGTIRDDFADPTSGWLRRTRDASGADYQEGAYVVWADNDASSYVGSTGTYDSREFTDTRFEVQATKRSGPAGAPVGLLCRQWSEGDRRGVYFADLDGDGEIRIGLYDEDGQQILAEAEQPGLWREGANTLRFDCVGTTLTFFVNGEEVLSGRHDAFGHGRLGVRVGGKSSGVTRVEFDEAVITTID